MILNDVPDSIILIIDDSPDAIRLLGGMLKEQGQILFATTGESGLNLARQRQPQLILLDVDMPDMDGYDVCRHLKADPDTQDCAIIFVTAASTSESEIRALSAGAVDFITKPLNPPVVRARVQTHLKLQHQSAALAKLASKDGLTGLYNRRYFAEQLDKEFQRHKRQKLPLGLAMIDVDHFKPYNDGYGHLEGDNCLRCVADCIALTTRRPGEIAARYGGEEFIVILPYTALEDAARYGELLCQRIRELGIVHAYSPPGVVTASVGVTSAIPEEGGSGQALVAAADRALYSAKAAGRDCARSMPRA